MDNENHELPEQEESKNEQEERKELIECLALAYGVTPRDEAGYYFNYGKYNQKEIARELGFDNSTLGKMLQPDWNQPRNRSYKPLIACLRKQIEINDLKQSLHSLEQKRQIQIDELNQRLKKEDRKRNLPFVASLVALMLLGILSFNLFFGYRKYKKQADWEKEHVITNAGDFAQLYSGPRGEAVAKRMVNESYPIVKEIQGAMQNGSTLSDIEKEKFISRIQNLIITVDGDERFKQRQENIVVRRDVNVVDIVDRITPRNSLFVCLPSEILQDSLPDCANNDVSYDIGLWKIKYLFFDPNISEESYKTQLTEAIIAFQNTFNPGDLEALSKYLRTGELPN